MKSTGLTPLAIAAVLPVRGVDYFQWDQVAAEPWAPALVGGPAYGAAAGYPVLNVVKTAAPVEEANYRAFPYVGYTPGVRKIHWTMTVVFPTSGFAFGSYVEFRLHSALIVRQYISPFDAVLYRTDIVAPATGLSVGTELSTGTNSGVNTMLYEIEYTPLSLIEVFMTVPVASGGTGLRTRKASVAGPEVSAANVCLAPTVAASASAAGWGVKILTNRLSWE